MRLSVLLLLLACREDGDPKYSTDADGDGIRSDEDCDDADASVGLAETWFTDGDSDGVGGDLGDTSCAPPADAVAETGDCDDADPTVYPAAPEACDGNDQDCDGEVDEDLELFTIYTDADNDGFGDDNTAVSVCERADADVEVGGDCDDADPTINPAAAEACDGLDQDCDGLVDEDLGGTTWYIDNDGDGYGDVSTGVDACVAPEGTVPDGGDCDDTQANYNPGADETDCADPNDYNCDGSTGYADADGDGFAACSECDDSLATVNPAGIEQCNGVDDDCDGNIDDDAADVSSWYADLDGDGYGDPAALVLACEAPAGSVADNTDCDDTNAGIAPGLAELCDGLDQDCDGEVDEDPTDPVEYYTDADADGFGDSASGSGCSAPSGTSFSPGDCNDADPATYPGAEESDCSDPTDYNCDGSTGYLDDDGDGSPACEDCDDSRADVLPGGIETCDGVDQDCDGEIDEDGLDAALWYDDGDSDGFGDPSTGVIACSAPAGSTADNTDCDDTRASVAPGLAERCDGVDQDCDGLIDEDAEDAAAWYTDADTDGFGAGSPSFGCDAPAGTVALDGDCNDEDPAFYPGAPESDCADPNDYSCDGVVAYADLDGDGSAACEDCDDADANAAPGAEERCDGADNDCDGTVDEADATDAAAWYADTDGDGYGAGSVTIACEPPPGTVGDDQDCDDANAGINPGQTEVCDPGDTDEDCSGAADDADPGVDPSGTTTFYLDVDGDGFGDPASGVATCDPGRGRIGDSADCDDTEANVYPGAPEICSGDDLDCDGALPEICTSCLDHLVETGATADGLYTIDPDGAGALGSIEVWCDMTTALGGWTLVQRTLWDWADTALLDTGYATWFGSTLGDANPGNVFRLAGELWPLVSADAELMAVHTPRDARSTDDCDPLYYLAENASFSVTSSSATVTVPTSTAVLVNSTGLSTADSGGSTACVNTFDAVPWFYSYCCTTCPSFKGGYWTDTAHPMASYLDTTPDLQGLTDNDVCPSGSAVVAAGGSYEGINVMEYYVR